MLLTTNKLTVLVNSADAATRQLLQTSLSRWGYQAISLADAGDTKILLQYESASVCILDASAGEGGLELCSWIRSRNMYPAPEIIVLTSGQERGELHAAYQAGADYYLVQPLNCDELLPLLAGIAARLEHEAEMKIAAHKFEPMDAYRHDLQTRDKNIPKAG